MTVATRVRMASRGAAAGVTDSFNRADSSTSLGTADTGQAWSALVGTWGISSNRMYRTTSGAGDRCAISAGFANQLVTATMVAFSTGTGGDGVMARVTDADNWYLVYHTNTNNIQVYKNVAGSISQIGTQNTGITRTAGETLGIRVVGTAIDALVNGSVVGSRTDSALTTGNLGGIYAGIANTALRVDDFSIVAA